MTLQAREEEPIARDGKRMRGAVQGEQKALHRLSFCTHHTQEILVQVRVDEKTNEIPIARSFSPVCPLQNGSRRLMLWQTRVHVVRPVRHWQSDVVLTVTSNQPTLFAELATSFADLDAPCLQDSATDEQRERVDVRSSNVRTELAGSLSAIWAQSVQVAKRTRTATVRRTDTTPREIVSPMTTPSASRASPPRVLSLVRGHWCLENSLHDGRDVTVGEDRSRLRTGYAPPVMAALRHLALPLMHRCGQFPIASAQRHVSSHPQEALALLLPPIVVSLGDLRIHKL